MSKATPGEAVFLKVIIISALFVEVGYFYVFESDNYMIILKLKTRLKKDRLLTSVTIRMPEDVIDDLKQIAPVLGFSGYQPLKIAWTLTQHARHWPRQAKSTVAWSRLKSELGL